jgi:biotin operon repressor
MSFISQKQLAQIAGISETTLWRRLKALKFKKKSPGRFYDEKEQQQISQLLNFTLKLNGHEKH